MTTKHLKKSRGINQPYKRQDKLEDLHPNDLKIYVEIIEEIMNAHNIPKSEILNKLRIKNKKQSCLVLGIARQKIYEQPTGRNIQVINPFIQAKINHIFKKNYGIYGFKKIYHTLLNQGYNYSIWTIRKTYEELNLIARKLRSPKDNRSPRNSLTHVSTQNIINRNFTSDQANQKWFIDSSFIRLKNNMNLWLCAIIDVYANKIVVWKLGYINDSKLAIATLASDIHKHNAPKIIHADHGTNFLSKEFLAFLNQHHIIQSNSRVANSLDNRPIEYFFGCLKYEWLYHVELKDYKTSFSHIEYYVNWYNKCRIQSNLNYMAPNNYLSNFHQVSGKPLTF